MHFSKKDLIIIAGSIIVILVNIYSIAMGTTGTGFYISVFAIVVFSILLINTVYRVTRLT
jgi:FtsH-binding integral membrane protein